MNFAKVCIVKTETAIYPEKGSGFRPERKYPEYIFDDISCEPNEVYDLIRNGFRLMGLDEKNFGKKHWNPLKDIVNPGDTVLIKPNMVFDHNKVGTVDSLYTHPSVVAAVIDYVLIAQKGRGKIIVGDAPVQECDFEKLVLESGYKNLIDFYIKKGIDIKLEDFRDLKSTNINGVYHQNVDDDKSGVEVHLDENSEFFYLEKPYDKFRITNYSPSFLPKVHNKYKHVYYINKSALAADVVINMPKPKTHRKAGVTISLKNIVGINSRKEYLPHHVMGSLVEGGDEYLNKSILKRIRSMCWDIRNENMSKEKCIISYLLNIIIRALGVFIKYVAKDEYSEGSWYGNSTISKTIVDLNKILLYADKDGNITNKVQRKVFIVADMIISGEGEGPLIPSNKDVGIIAMGDNPIGFDTVIAKIMGADIDEIPTINDARNVKSPLKLPVCDYIRVLSNDKRWNEKDIEKLAEIKFIPTRGWKKVFKG